MAVPTEPKNFVNDITKKSVNKRKLSPKVNSKLTNVKKKVKNSRTGSDTLCQCYLRCSEHVPQQAREELFHMISGMNRDDANSFLQTLIELRRPLSNQNFVGQIREDGTMGTRVCYKYLIPIMVSENSPLDPDDDEEKESEFNEKSPVISKDCQNDKVLESDSIEIAGKFLNSYHFIEICKVALISIFGITGSRFRNIRQSFFNKSRRELLKDTMETELNTVEEVDPSIVSLAKNLALYCKPMLENYDGDERKKVAGQFMVAMNNDLNLLSEFFCNQLWNPKYID